VPNPPIALEVTLRPAPGSASRVAPLDYEIAQEQASALGRLGRSLEAALVALSEFDRGHAGPSSRRSRLMAEASDALWCFIVQREACGLRDPRPVMRDYGVPAEVQNRMGIVAGRRRTA